LANRISSNISKCTPATGRFYDAAIAFRVQLNVLLYGSASQEVHYGFLIQRFHGGSHP